jgi:hypothetical protein
MTLVTRFFGVDARHGYLLLRTAGPGISILLWPGRPLYSQRVRPTGWRTRWFWVRLLWGMP